MSKTQKANFPTFANLHGKWSKINTSIISWKVFESEGFVLGELYSVGVFTQRIKKWIGEYTKHEHILSSRYLNTNKKVFWF